MRYRRLTLAAIGTVVLLLASCSASRTATSAVSSSRFQVSGATRDTVREQVVVEVHDTLREVIAITVDRNDRGDTLRLETVTDRTRATDRTAARDKEEKLIVRTDTVYVEKRDSTSVQELKGLSGSSGLSKTSNFVSSLKWIFGILCAIVVLIIVVRLGLRRSLF